MRILLAIAVVAGGLIAPSPSVEAGRGYMRTKPPCYAPRRVWKAPCGARPYRPYANDRPYSNYRPYDPTGEFRGFPPWARKAFSDPRN
jgi:hypothetical protein